MSQRSAIAIWQAIRLAVDEDDTIFAEQPILARIIDEARDEEQFFRTAFEIVRQRRRIVDPGKAGAGMRSARPGDDGKGEIGGNVGKLGGRMHHIFAGARA